MTKHAHFDGTAAAAKTAPVPPLEEEKQDLCVLLRNTQVHQVPDSGKPLIELKTSMTPLESATILWENGILGAPVWDEEHKKYVGIFDMRDLLSTVLLEQIKKDAAKKDNPNTTWFPENLHTSYLAARNPFVGDYTQDSTLYEICQELCRKETHLIPLVDPATKRCTRVLSRSYLIKFLSQNVALPTTTLQQAKFPYRKDVIQAPDTATAQDVFHLMDIHRLSGIAIVDAESGKLVGNTSATDIKAAVRVGGNSEEDRVDMKMDILSYLAQVRQHSLFDQYPSAHVHEDSSVAHAVHLLAKTGFHRIFVVDADLRPIGVVSVTDVIQYVVTRVQAEENEGK